MRLEYLLEQLRRRSKLSFTRKPKRPPRNRVSARHSLFESLEPRRLLAGDVSLSGNTLVVADHTNSDDDVSIEIVGSNFVISNNSALTTTGPGLSDLDSDPNKVTVAVDSITGITVNSSDGADTVELANLAGKTVTLNGGSGTDTYRLNNAWGNASITDSGGGILDLSSVTGAITVSESGGNVVVAANDGSQLTLDASGTFTGLDAFEPNVGKTNLDSSLSDLHTILDSASQTGLLDQSVSLLGNTAGTFGQSIGSFVDLAEILDVYVIDKLVNDFNNASSLNEIVGELNVSDLTGSLTGDVDVIGTQLLGGGMKLDATLDVQRVTPVKLDVFSGELGNALSLPDGTFVDANLTTAIQWHFDIGVDASGDFVGHFDLSDLVVSADVNKTVNVDTAAGFLGVNATGPLTFDTQITVNTDPLNNLSTASASSLAQSDTAGSDELTVQLNVAPIAGVGGTITPGTVNLVDTSVLDATAPVFSKSSFDDLDSFYHTDAATVLQMLQQFNSFLATLSAKALNNNVVPLTAGTTIGDLLDLTAIYDQNLLSLIELPPHTASTLVTDITLGDPLGTSGDAGAELNVTLLDGTSVNVNLDAGSTATLGAVIDTIVGTVNDNSKLQKVVHADGSMTLADLTSGGGTFSIVAKDIPGDPDGKQYEAVANLGLDGKSLERDVVGDSNLEAVYDVAPNPGANYATIQEMMALITSGVDSSISGIQFDNSDPSTLTLAFTIDIDVTGSNASDTLALLNLGSLEDLVTTSGTVNVLNPTASLNLPFELELTPLGFDSPLTETTWLKDLNAGAGVTVIEGEDDVRIHVADGTTFTIDLDAGLAATTLTSLGAPDAAGDELTITLNDGTSFAIDFSTDVDSTGAPPTTLGELVELIQAEADAATTDARDLEVLIDSARGTFRFVDHTSECLASRSPDRPQAQWDSVRLRRSQSAARMCL